MVPRGLKRHVQFPEVLERLVAPHFLLCEQSIVVCRLDCKKEVRRHVRAEFSSPKSYKSIKIGGNDAYTKKKKRRGTRRIISALFWFGLGAGIAAGIAIIEGTILEYLP